MQKLQQHFLFLFGRREKTKEVQPPFPTNAHTQHIARVVVGTPSSHQMLRKCHATCMEYGLWHVTTCSCAVCVGTQPATVACKMEGQFGIRTRCAHVFCTFGADLYAQSVLVNKNFCISSVLVELAYTVLPSTTPRWGGGGEWVQQWITARPNQQRTLNKLPTELRCRSFANKHRLSIQIGAKCAKNMHATCIYSN